MKLTTKSNIADVVRETRTIDRNGTDVHIDKRFLEKPSYASQDRARDLVNNLRASEYVNLSATPSYSPALSPGNNVYIGIEMLNPNKDNGYFKK